MDLFYHTYTRTHTVYTTTPEQLVSPGNADIFIVSTINLPAVNSLCLDKTLPVNFLHSTCS